MRGNEGGPSTAEFGQKEEEMLGNQVRVHAREHLCMLRRPHLLRKRVREAAAVGRRVRANMYTWSNAQGQ